MKITAIDSPMLDKLAEVMSRASIGDLSARVDVCDDAPDLDDDLTVVAMMLNILLADLQYRADEAELAHRSEIATLEEADDRQADFFSMASHELRTPLTAISGFASTLTGMWDTLADERKLEFVKIIDEQSDRLSRLVNDVLTLSRLQRGNLAHASQTIHVHTVIARVRDMLPAAHLTIHCADHLHAYCDADYLEQILVNYVSNAFKYGEAPITVQAGYERGGIRIQVCDHGPGVPSNFRNKLFHRFTQAEERPEGSGTGLGLSIVHELARAQGGSAWYEPNFPNGSTFLVWLPTTETAVELTPSGNR